MKIIEKLSPSVKAFRAFDLLTGMVAILLVNRDVFAQGTSDKIGQYMLKESKGKKSLFSFFFPRKAKPLIIIDPTGEIIKCWLFDESLKPTLVKKLGESFPNEETIELIISC